MQGTLTKKPFSSPEWYFEPKLDGVRALAFINDGKIALSSRRGLDATKTYPEIVERDRRAGRGQMVLDGEIVAMDEAGVPSFQKIQQRLDLSKPADIPRDGGADAGLLLRLRPAVRRWVRPARRAPARAQVLLKQRLLPTERVILLDHFDAEGEAASEAAIGSGWKA